MRQISAIITLTTLAALLFSTAAARAQTFTTLYNFTGGSDGGEPYAGLIQGPSSNLYGTTAASGDLKCNGGYGCGVAFEVDTAGNETVLHAFTGYPSDGASPEAPVARDKSGNIYGTTFNGGSGNCGNGHGCGTVYKMDSAGSETVFYSFTGGSDGCYPAQGLVVGKSDTLFGTTWSCGSADYGTIFRVDSAGKLTLLHSFAGSPSDGAEPIYGHLARDKSGNLYGVTSAGGTSNYGTLYKLSKGGKFTLLHSFQGGTSDGCTPQGSVVQDKVGNFYGTSSSCGSSYNGTIWKVGPKGKDTILYSFAGGPNDGSNPEAGVALDSKGNLYGVTAGGTVTGYGALYELSAKGTLTLLHTFDGSDGEDPAGEVLWTAKGTLFGTTPNGGTHGYGTVWKYVP